MAVSDMSTENDPRAQVGQSRRDLLKFLSGLPLATVLANPVLARKRASLLQTVALKTKKLNKKVTASLAMPEDIDREAPTVLLIHEWYGLNDQIRSVAAEFAKHGYIALAADLYDRRIGFTPEECSALMSAVKADEAEDTLVSWIDWLKNHELSTSKTGTVGWCFGGGWSLRIGMATPVDATIVYYGDVTPKADQLRRLRGPVLGHFASRDGWITPRMVAGFEKEMRSAGKRLTAHAYEAEHAFANPTKASYDDEDAILAWRRSLAFYEEHLQG